MSAHRTRFDEQAGSFDRRAGVGAAARVIVESIAGLTGGGMGTVLEIGPGTGEIGAHLAAVSSRYAGIDASYPMLEAFARRRPSDRAVVLILADAARRWPVQDQIVDLIFSSRAAHLLDVDHVAAEAVRVGRPGARLLVGRVQRPRGGLRNRLRDQRRVLLAERGVSAPEGRDRTRRLLETLVAGGAEPIPRTEVAAWTVSVSARDLLDQWDAGATVGSTPVPGDVHAAVMATLRAGAPTESVDEIETYTVEGVRLPRRPEIT